jgi:hypothetical protein
VQHGARAQPALPALARQQLGERRLEPLAVLAVALLALGVGQPAALSSQLGTSLLWRAPPDAGPVPTASTRRVRSWEARPRRRDRALGRGLLTGLATRFRNEMAALRVY